MGYKQLKEAYKKLQASFVATQRQLKNAKNRNEILTQDKNKANLRASRARKRVTDVMLKLSGEVKDIKYAHKQELREASKSNSELAAALSSSEKKVSELRLRYNSAYSSKNRQSVRIKELNAEVRELKSRNKTIQNKLDRELNREPKVITKILREKKVYYRNVKSPLPEKIRNIMTSNDATKSRVDIVAQVSEFNRFCKLTKIPQGQMLILLEAHLLKYFRLSSLSHGSFSQLRELEGRGLLIGDRRDTETARGWFITPKGNRVAEMVISKMLRNTLTRDYVRNGYK